LEQAHLVLDADAGWLSAKRIASAGATAPGLVSARLSQLTKCCFSELILASANPVNKQENCLIFVLQIHSFVSLRQFVIYAVWLLDRMRLAGSCAFYLPGLQDADLNAIHTFFEIHPLQQRMANSTAQLVFRRGKSVLALQIKLLDQVVFSVFRVNLLNLLHE